MRDPIQHTAISTLSPLPRSQRAYSPKPMTPAPMSSSLAIHPLVPPTTSPPSCSQRRTQTSCNIPWSDIHQSPSPIRRRGPPPALLAQPLQQLSSQSRTTSSRTPEIMMPPPFAATTPPTTTTTARINGKTASPSHEYMCSPCLQTRPATLAAPATRTTPGTPPLHTTRDTTRSHTNDMANVHSATTRRAAPNVIVLPYYHNHRAQYQYQTQHQQKHQHDFMVAEHPIPTATARSIARDNNAENQTSEAINDEHTNDTNRNRSTCAAPGGGFHPNTNGNEDNDRIRLADTSGPILPTHPHHTPHYNASKVVTESRACTAATAPIILPQRLPHHNYLNAATKTHFPARNAHHPAYHLQSNTCGITPSPTRTKCATSGMTTTTNENNRGDNTKPKHFHSPKPNGLTQADPASIPHLPGSPPPDRPLTTSSHNELR